MCNVCFLSCREEDDNRDDPDYQLPQDRKTEDAESDDDVDFDMEGKVASSLSLFAC